jgi:AP-2 complex subunit mu-1
VKSLFDSTNFATNVVVKIPVPTTDNVRVYATGSGKAKYEPEKQALMWRIKKFPGDSEFVITAEVTLT